MHDQLMLKAAARGKYAQLFRHLSTLDVSRWQTTFGDIESILGFTLPDSARIHRPWWSNQSNGGHSHALACRRQVGEPAQWICMPRPWCSSGCQAHHRAVGNRRPR